MLDIYRQIHECKYVYSALNPNTEYMLGPKIHVHCTDCWCSQTSPLSRQIITWHSSQWVKSCQLICIQISSKWWVKSFKTNGELKNGEKSCQLICIQISSKMGAGSSNCLPFTACLLLSTTAKHLKSLKYLFVPNLFWLFIFNFMLFRS